MTKLIEPIDTAATKGARKRAMQAHASMLTNRPLAPNAPKGSQHTMTTKTIQELVRELERAEDDAGYNGHTDAAHARILRATTNLMAATHEAQEALRVMGIHVTPLTE